MGQKQLLKPAIILVRPQLPENIGMVARVMQNFDLKDLILVRPREKWPNKKTINASKSASNIINKAKVYDSISEAISTFNLIVATTNRKRFLEKKCINQFNTLSKLIQLNKKSAILFGPENSGLSNEDLRLADYLFTIDTSNNNHSLNLSHAVAITSHKLNEFFVKNKKNIINQKKFLKDQSSKKEIKNFLNFLILNLDKNNFFYPAAKRESMIDNIYSIFLKSSLTKKEVKTLWGIIKNIGN